MFIVQVPYVPILYTNPYSKKISLSFHLTLKAVKLWMYSMTYLNNYFTYCLKLQKCYFNALKIVFSVNKVANLLIMPDLITKLPGTVAERKSVMTARS